MFISIISHSLYLLLCRWRWWDFYEL